MRSLRPFVALPLLVSLAACGEEPDVVLYCALDQEHAEPLIRRFEDETGLRVRAEFDIEANKTVGLVARLREEASNPRCDVFWNNEIAHTVALAEEGLLASYRSPSAAGIPDAFVDPEDRWTGFAARARILIVNTELADPETIHGMEDLFEPAWAGEVAMARPLTGTTLTHAATLFQVLGEEEARELLGRIDAANEAGELHLAPGNGHVMRRVREGDLAFGWTDTDDFNVAREAGYPVACVYPDQEDVGTLFIPNTVAILEGAPRPEAARRLVDWILSPKVEEQLAHERSAQIPLRPSVPRPEHVRGPESVKAMEVDFVEVGRALPERQRELKETFLD